MPFRQPHAVVVFHKFAMEKLRRRETERSVDQKLPRRGLEQVFTAHDFGDLHRRVVGHADELIRGHVVAPPDDEVAEIASRDEPLLAKVSIHEGNRLAVGHAETPRELG